MLDASAKRIKDWSLKHDFKFWQLRTPLTKYKRAPVPYALDNGCFTQFRARIWQRMIIEAYEEPMPVFVCLPDVVGDAEKTLELFSQFTGATTGLPRALVLQDGIGDHAIPWDKIEAVFVGGSDEFKTSYECMNACVSAKMLGKLLQIRSMRIREQLCLRQVQQNPTI